MSSTRGQLSTDSIPDTPQRSPAHIPLIVFVLLIIAFVPFAQTINHEFIAYDDNSYITENSIVQRGLTWEGMRFAFSTFHASNWHPLTWLSHMLDVQMFGAKNAGPHHLMSAAIHALNAAMLFAVLFRMTGAMWRSAIVAALFAVHPLHVESVAWVSERKDVLSTFFGLIAIWMYLMYTKRVSTNTISPARERSKKSTRFVEAEGLGEGANLASLPRRWIAYALMLICFALSLLAKPMLVTLPFVLLLLDYWPLRRWNKVGGGCSATQLIFEKLPLFALTIASCLITIRAQQLGGAIFPIEAMPLEQRVQNVFVAYAAYIGQMFWPVKLAVLYPHPGEWETWRVALSVMVLAAISAVAAGLSRKRPVLLVGWLFFLGTLVPVIGLVQVGVQSIADRYTYVPLIGLFMMFAWSLPSAHVRLVAPAVLAIVIALTARTFVQVSYWENSFTLFDRALAITHHNYVIQTNLGFAHRKAGRLDEAIRHYRAALEMNELYGPTLENLGNALVAVGDPAEAVNHLERAAALRPDLARTQSNLGAALFQAGRIDEAEARFRRSVEIDPRYAQGHFNLGRVYSSRTQRNEAIGAYRAALDLDPSLAQAHMYIGIELAAQGQYDQAIAEFQSALRLRPNDGEVQRYLQGAILLRDREKQP